MKTIHLTSVLGCLLAVAGTAEAHRTYNVTGFAGVGDLNGDSVVDVNDGTLFSTNGSDGLWTGYPGAPLSTSFAYSGGGGPNCGNASTCPADESKSASYYRGLLPVSWGAFVHEAANTPGDVYVMSTADALAVGASTPKTFSLAVSGSATGTGMDFGYIRIDNQNRVRITVSADNSSLQPFIALYGGWDASWSGANGTVREPFSTPSSANRGANFVAGNNPFGSLFLQAIVSATGSSQVVYEFDAPTRAHYTLLIGGANGSAGAYQAVVETVAPVPLPAAAWLLVSALGGLGIAGRRK